MLAGAFAFVLFVRSHNYDPTDPSEKRYLQPLTLFQLLVFLRSVQMATNQKVLSNRASDKSRVSGVGSIVTAVSIAFQKGGTLYTYQKILVLYTRL